MAKLNRYGKPWSENDSHLSICASRVIKSAECTCGKIDTLAEQEENSTSPKLVQTGWRSDGSSPSEPSTGLRDATQMTLLELTDIAREVEVVLPQAAEVIREIRDKLQKFVISSDAGGFADSPTMY